jgi:hypothetical protein
LTTQRRDMLGLIGTLCLAALVVVAAAKWVPPGTAAPQVLDVCGAAGGAVLSSTDLASELPASFASGSIQSFGSNDTSVLFGGLSYYHRGAEPYDSLPALGTLSPGSGTSQDLTPRTSWYFDEGGVFPIGWNGTAWLVAGQTTVGGLTEGSAISLQNGQVTNLTPLVAPYFQQQGIWIAGWNGHGWLLGGNNSQGAALIYLQGGIVTNLTGLLPNNAPGNWIQMVAWNGSGWLVGGQGIFGAYEDGKFTNLFPQSPFAPGGVFAFDWNGSSWLAGGSPVGLALVHGDHVESVPSPIATGEGWVNSIVSLGGDSWMVSGGTTSSYGRAPFVALVSPTDLSDPVTNETGCLSAGFEGGFVQFSGWAPVFGARSLLFVGEKGTDAQTSSSQAAAEVLTIGG